MASTPPTPNSSENKAASASEVALLNEKHALSPRASEPSLEERLREYAKRWPEANLALIREAAATIESQASELAALRANIAELGRELFTGEKEAELVRLRGLESRAKELTSIEFALEVAAKLTWTIRAGPKAPLEPDHLSNAEELRDAIRAILSEETQ
jgi:hypothetical protein